MCQGKWFMFTSSSVRHFHVFFGKWIIISSSIMKHFPKSETNGFTLVNGLFGSQNDVFTSIAATIKSVEKPFNQWATLCDYQVSQLRTSDTLIIFFNSNECDTQWVRPENFRSSLSRYWCSKLTIFEALLNCCWWWVFSGDE